MKKLITIPAIIASVLVYGQNEWKDTGGGSPNASTINMYRTANVGIGAALATPPLIPLAVEDNTGGGIGTKCVIGGQALNSFLSAGESALEIQSNQGSSASWLSLTSGVFPNLNYFQFGVSPIWGTAIYSNKGGTATAQPITFWTSGSALSERMRITPSGRIGIGTASPSATLQVNINATTGVDGSVAFVGPSFATFSTGPVVSGTGTRVIWVPDYAAFRAGQVSGPEWDATNLGQYSVALGLSPKASGSASFAANAWTHATGDNSTAFGWNTYASGPSSFSANEGNSASGLASAVFGEKNTASGQDAFAAGHVSNAAGDQSFAIMNKCIANGNSSFASGDFTAANGSASAAFNSNSNSLANNSGAFGDYTTSWAFDEFVLGRFNYNYTGASAETWVKEDPIFQIGIGNDAHSTADAVTVLKNGDVGIGQPLPHHLLELITDDAYKPSTATWGILSDQRLKTDITDYEKGLSDLRKIHIVNYRYNGKAGLPTDFNAVGVLAQEIQKILPNTVKKVHIGNDPEEYLGFNASEIIFLLVNSVKELSTENDNLKMEIKAIHEELELIKSKLNFDDKTIQKSYLRSIAPNPFRDKTTINFVLPEKMNSGLITITNANGITVKSFNISKEQNGELIIEGSTLADGTYYCTLWIDGQKTDSKTLILLK